MVAGMPRSESPINVPGWAGLRDSTADLAGLTSLPRAASDNSIYGIDVSREAEKGLIDALARHVVYSEFLSYIE